MKLLFKVTTLITLAVAVTTTTCALNQAQAQAAPAAAADTGAAADIQPGSPLADVVKMLQAGVDGATIKSYILASQTPFNLDADKIVYLRDLGASSDLINSILERDKVLYAASVAAPPAPAPAPVAYAAPTPAPAPETPPPAPDASVAPPPAEVTVDYLNASITPYGSWVAVEGYGRCWRPTVAMYNAAWSPYCDGGHWVYTDYGWYWDSDYSWGVAFHYGRWFRDPRFGWCWYPDTIWAPSWVAWRSGDEYCGWAPLPPFAVFTPGVGFFYRGVAVGVDFDFGLTADCFLFVSPDHFCDRYPRSFCVPRDRAVEVFHRTKIINNYNVHDKMIVNRGFGTERIVAATHHSLEPMRVSSLSNAGRQGWRGEGYQRTLQPAARISHPNENPAHAAPGANLNPARNNAVGSSGATHEVNAGAASRVAAPTTTRAPQATQAQPPNRGASTTPGQYQIRSPGATGGTTTPARGGTQFPQREPTGQEVARPNNSQTPETHATPPAQTPAQGQAPAQSRATGNNANNTHSQNKQPQ
jgi:hypothetical protein